MTDRIDSLISDWQQERPELNVESMAVEGRILRLANHYEQALVQVLKPYNLQYSELDVLATLRRKGKPYQLNPKRLMESVVLSSGAMTACLDRLEKRDLVKRIADPTDRRGRLIQLTSSGKDLVDEAIKARFGQASLNTQILSRNELDELAQLLTKLTIAIEHP